MHTLETTIAALYQSICFEAGSQPAPDQLYDLFIKEGLLINNNGETPLVMSVSDFVNAYKKNLEAGNITALEEKEIYAKTEVFGKIAHRFSTYELRLDPKSEKPFSTGINTIQLIEQNGRWLIASMAWNDEKEGMKIDAGYLP